MTDVAIHSIRPLADPHAPLGWRIASANTPIAVAELAVVREEERDLSPATLLLLETIRMLEIERGSATLGAVSEISGIDDMSVITGVVVLMAEQGLVILDGESIRQSPKLVITERDARVEVEVREQVCVIGKPPMPLHSLDPGRLSRLRAFDSVNESFRVSADLLNAWKTRHWDENVISLTLRDELRPKEYVLEGSLTGGGGLNLRDESSSVRLVVPAGHEFADQLLCVIRPMLDNTARLLSPFGKWNADSAELQCTGEHWSRWRAEGGHDVSEVILLSEGLHLAIGVRCSPADEASARAILLDRIVEALDRQSLPCTDELLAKVIRELRNGGGLFGAPSPAPTFGDVEARAWESGRWQLCYRIAMAADGL